MGQDLADSTLCVIGMGKIGLEVAKRALAFEMRVVYHNRSRRTDVGEEFGYCADLKAALGASDFVCISTPLTTETHHFIGWDELCLMKRNAILVNIARGPVVDNEALYRAVRDGIIAGAGLDVTEPEPIPSDHPLLTLPNVVITPHIGSSTVRTRRGMAVLAARNIVARLRGEAMPSCVNLRPYSSFIHRRVMPAQANVASRNQFTWSRRNGRAARGRRRCASCRVWHW